MSEEEERRSAPRDGEDRPRRRFVDGDRRSASGRDGARKPYAKRDDDRKPYAKRDGEKKPYAKRDGDRRPYTPRDGDKKPYAKRDGERKPYAKRDGERRPFTPRDGEKKPYAKRDGDRRPYTPRDGERKPYAKRDGDRRPYTPRDGERKPYAKRDGDRRPYSPRDGEKKPYVKRDGDRSRTDRSRTDRPRDDRPRREQWASERTKDPILPEDITARDLHPSARNELKTLSKENADAVARHLAMAARLIDEDPALAHEHAEAASRRAGRVAVVREAVAITAYAQGDFALALRELRTYRRISGRNDQIALIVDSERGVGRPDRALEEGRAADRASLPTATRVALAIAMSGARLDRGELELALGELEIPELDPDRAFEWSPALFAARAAVLEDLGRDEEAAFWNERAEVATAALDDGSDDEIIVDDIQVDLEELDGTELPASTLPAPAPDGETSEDTSKDSGPSDSSEPSV